MVCGTSNGLPSTQYHVTMLCPSPALAPRVLLRLLLPLRKLRPSPVMPSPESPMSSRMPSLSVKLVALPLLGERDSGIHGDKVRAGLILLVYVRFSARWEGDPLQQARTTIAPEGHVSPCTTNRATTRSRAARGPGPGGGDVGTYARPRPAAPCGVRRAWGGTPPPHRDRPHGCAAQAKASCAPGSFPTRTCL